jgi:hypothetical protein
MARACLQHMRLLLECTAGLRMATHLYPGLKEQQAGHRQDEDLAALLLLRA